MEKCNLFEELKERQYLYQTSDEEAVKKLCNEEKITVYAGYDPTADSLHIGHCVSLIMLSKFQKAGHRVIVLLGGATAQIGDPSGRNDMRDMVTSQFIQDNHDKIKQTIGRFVKLDGPNPAIILNNADWMNGYDYVNFMRDVGSHFNVSEMLATDACSTRMASGGLTFFEMGYQLIQAYDFAYLNKKYGCTLQIGGSDQWANMVAGTKLIRKLTNGQNEVHIVTCPLLLSSSGQKMGKSAKGAMWIDESRVTAFEFFQYFYNRDDNDVEMLLVRLSDLPMEKIKEIMSGDIRDAKRIMAYEVTKTIHGKEKADKALELSLNMFANNNYDNAPEFKADSLNILDILVNSNLCSSKGEARRMIEQGGISVNNNKVTSINYTLCDSDFSDGYAVVKKGKKQIVKVVK